MSGPIGGRIAKFAGRCVAFAFALAFAVAATAAEPERIMAQPCAKDRPGEKDIGVVFMHGKRGTPRYLEGFRETVENAGYMVDTPYMPWARDRAYDKTYGEAMREIDGIVEKMKSLGAKRIVVAGHSLGGNAALGYAATRKGLVGVVPIAPGHAPERPGTFQQKVAPYVREARDLVRQGRGGEVDDFLDVARGKWFTVRAKAEVYVSFFDPEGPAAMPKNAAAVEPGTPVLWIEASAEDASVFGPDYAFVRIPPHPKSAFVYVTSDHSHAPAASTALVVAWLNCL